jgi:tetratricopeptide (TPR) repeat protein
MAKAVEEARRAVEISPNAAMQRMNLSMFACYAGDFATGEREARQVEQLNPSYEKGYLTLAYAQLGQGQVAQATDTYHKLEKISPFGASLATVGLADVAVYQGRFSEAVVLLESAAKADLNAGKTEAAAEKFTALARAQLSWGHGDRAIAAADRALASSKKPNLQFLAARVLVGAGAGAKARVVAAALAAGVEAEPQTDAKLLAGELELKQGAARNAIQIFTDANHQLDTWIGRFDLGRAYLQAGLYTEADSEFDACLKRRGEALELYDAPTYGYVPPVYYFQGKVREGLKSAGFVESYRTYLNIRGAAGEDPLLKEVRSRVGDEKSLTGK